MEVELVKIAKSQTNAGTVVDVCRHQGFAGLLANIHFNVQLKSCAAPEQPL